MRHRIGALGTLVEITSIQTLLRVPTIMTLALFSIRIVAALTAVALVAIMATNQNSTAGEEDVAEAAEASDVVDGRGKMISVAKAKAMVVGVQG